MTTTCLNFTKQLIVDLPPASPGDRNHYRDTREPALRLEVTEKGKKTYKVYRKAKGRPVRYTIGDVRDWTLSEARREAARVNSLLGRGINPNIEKRRIREEITFGKMLDEYIERYSKKHRQSWENDRHEIARFVSHWFSRRLSSIGFDEVQRLHQKVGRENGKVIANRLIARIRGIYNKAVEWGWQGDNPALRVKPYREHSRDRFIQPGELPFFFEALHAEENETARDYILLSLFTGARKSNVLSMCWTDIDFERHVWRMPETKNGEPLTIPLSQEAIDLLLRRRELTNGKWVLPSERTDDHLHDARKAWRRILTHATIKIWQRNKDTTTLVAEVIERDEFQNAPYDRILFRAIEKRAKERNVDLPTGLMDLRLHDLRRTLGSYQAASGANQYIIGKSLGHKSAEATAIYARLDLDPVRQSVQTATTAMLTAAQKSQTKK